MIANAGGAADRIRRLGFQKWYERQLLESHAYLVTCILSMLLVLGLLEEFDFRALGLKALVSLAAMAGGALLSLFSWQRYRTIMLEAHRLGERSTCPDCGAYARFDVVETGGSMGPSQVGDGGVPATWLRVRCRKCGHGWTMP